MSDLRERFRSLDHLQPPDLRADIRARPPSEPRREIRWARVGTAALALAVAAAGFAVAMGAFLGEEERREPVDRLAGPVENGSIALSTGNAVSLLDPDGSRLRPLIKTSPGQRLVPWEWSPDGSWLALYGANFDIYVVEADGSGLRNLTTDASDAEAAASQGDPTWSPDGRMLAFTELTAETNVIQVIEIDGTGRRTVTDPSNPGFTPDPSPHGLQAYAPEWSPDGTAIAFARYLKSGGEIYSVAPDGSQLQRLTDGGSSNSQPTWSPDGSRIAFQSNRTGANEIFMMAADGSGEEQLTHVAGKNIVDPQWSPDGTRLIFQLLDDGDWDIWSVNADGTGQMRLTDDPGDEIYAVWAPDGTRIAYVASPMGSREGENLGTFDVYVMDPDGTDVERLARSLRMARLSLAWQPVYGSESELDG